MNVPPISSQILNQAFFYSIFQAAIRTPTEVTALIRQQAAAVQEDPLLLTLRPTRLQVITAMEAAVPVRRGPAPRLPGDTWARLTRMGPRPPPRRGKAPPILTVEAPTVVTALALRTPLVDPLHPTAGQADSSPTPLRKAMTNIQ